MIGKAPTATHLNEKEQDYFPNSSLEDHILSLLKTALSIQSKREHELTGSNEFLPDTGVSFLNSAFSHYAAAIAAERGVDVKQIEQVI